MTDGRVTQCNAHYSFVCIDWLYYCLSMFYDAQIHVS